MKQAPVGITILRGKTFLVEMANDSYLNIVARSEDELVGKLLFDALPEVQEYVEPILNNVLETGEPFHGDEFEVTLRRLGKTEQCYFNFIYKPLVEPSGEISGIIVVATEVTQQVLSKQKLQRSENQFRNLVTQSQFAKAIFKGKDFVISIANETMLKDLWRRAEKDVVGRKLFDVFPELEQQKFGAALKNVFETGKIYRENEAVAFVDGPDGTRTFYLDYQYAPIFELDGKVGAIMVSANDVTEKVKFRQQISDAADRLSLATDGTKLATWDLNLQTKDIIYSGRLATLFGYDEYKLLTHAELRDHVHPDDRFSIVEKAFEQALKTGSYYYEARVIHPDKSIHWIRTQGKVLYQDNHIPHRMLGTMMDITDRKESELALKTSEGKFRTLADSMPQFVWTGDREGNLNYFNKSVYDYTGLTPAEMHKHLWRHIVHPDDLKENTRLWNISIENGTDFVREHRLRRFDGEFRWKLSRAIPQRNPDGTIMMWVGTSTDIHESKLFIDQLETKVQQRTKELTVANNELIKTNMELAQFAYVASHDLQEPLRKIQTFATRILETELGNLSEKGRDYFNRMQASSARMQQLIVDLLAFSRANAIEKHFEKTDLNEVLKIAQEQLAEVILQKNAVIKSDVLPHQNVIVYQFEQLFTNIIANALKFVRPGERPIIEIKTGQIAGHLIPLSEADSGLNYTYISFSDNGIGFDQQFKDRIFQVFQRLHGRSSYDGTGIGLAICKKIVENHKGLLDAIGKPGIGATFIIYLPEAH
ncbi:PAS domain-containing protein [Dyadobacter sp. UC 10]|nr:PAS domain-containing protein [Dyadobacter sp. UC 10]